MAKKETSTTIVLTNDELALGFLIVASENAEQALETAIESFSSAYETAALATFHAVFPDGGTIAGRGLEAKTIAAAIVAASAAQGITRTAPTAPTIGKLAEVGRFLTLEGTYNPALNSKGRNAADAVAHLIGRADNNGVKLTVIRKAIAGSATKADALKAIGALGKAVEVEVVTDENGNDVEVEVVESAFDKAVASAVRAIAKALKAMPEGITAEQVAAAAALASEAAMLSIAAAAAAPSTATATDTAEAFATASELATV